MINHGRTLLLNRSAQDMADVGGVYVPEEFRPLVLTDMLAAVRSVLVPNGLPPGAEEYVVNTIMQLLHAPELSPFLLQLDPRYTYSTSGATLFQFATPSLTVSMSKSVDCDVVPKYRVTTEYPRSLAQAGRHQWQATGVDASSVAIRSSDGTVAYRVVPLGGIGVTPEIELVPGYLYAYFELPSRYFTGTYVIDYSTVLAPAYDVASRVPTLTALLMRAGYSSQLFEPWDPYSDAIANCRTMWAESVEGVLRFGAVVLAHMFQCERLRLKM